VCSEGCSQCEDSSACQVCADGYMLSEWSLCVEKKENSQNVASSSTFEGASLIGSAFSSGGSLPFNFGLVSKMVRNVKYLNITVSSELRQSFVSWTATSSFLKAPQTWGSNSNSNSRILQEVFDRYGLESAFLINYWKTLILTLAGVVLFGIFKIIETCFTKDNSKGRSIMRSIHIAASNFALTQFYSNLDDVVLYLAFDARTFKFDTSFDGISFIIGVIAMMIGIIAVGVHILLLRKYQGLKKKQAEAEFEAFKAKSQNVDLLFKDFKDTGFSTQSFLLVYLIRCIITSLIFALLFDYPFLQILILLFLNAIMITYLLVVRPFKDFFDTCGQFFSEFILLLVNICMFILCIFDQVGSKPLEAIDKLSSCVIILNMILLVGCAIFLVISILRLFYNLYKIYRERKQIKNTALVLSSLTKKFDQLKLTQNMDQKTSGLEQSNESQQNLHNVTDQGGISLEKQSSNSVLFENQAEDVFETSQGNLDLSGYFAERDLKLKYGAGVKPCKVKVDEKKQEEEKLSNSGVLNHSEAADIDSDENQTEKDLIPLQDFEATFKRKKKKAPQAENIKENRSNHDVKLRDSFAGRDQELKGESQTKSPEMKKLKGELDEIGEKEEENFPTSAIFNHDEGGVNVGLGSSFIEGDLQPKKENSRVEDPKAEGELDEIKGENEEKNVSTSGAFNHDESADIGPCENQTENNLISLQLSEANFKKKKKKALKAEERKVEQMRE